MRSNRLNPKFLLPGIILLIVLGYVGIVSAQVGNTLTSVKVAQAPNVDGQVDSLWSSAPGITIDVAGGANLPGGSTKVNLYSVYTNDSVYFLAEWWDPTQSLRRSPWQKQTDGTWKQVKDTNDKGGDNNLVYEDKFAFIWNINDSIKGFNEQGCMVTCHAGEAGKPYGNKYTASAGETGDIWHWKGVRTGTVGQIDDQYLDDTRYNAQTAPEAGRKSDPKTAGGYTDNISDDKTKPKFGAPDQKPAPAYWILDNEKQALDDTRYKANDEVAGIIVAPFTGDRGDLTAKSTYSNGKYTLEWGRKLDTGSKFDIQFTDLAKPYFFGVAVFDNAQVRHAFNTGAYKLVFQQAAAAGAQPAPTSLPRTGGPAFAGGLFAALGLLAIGLGWAVRRFGTK